MRGVQKIPVITWITGIWVKLPFLRAVWTGLEPATPCVTGTYSNQLNYQTVFVGAANLYLLNLLQSRFSINFLSTQLILFH